MIGRKRVTMRIMAPGYRDTLYRMGWGFRLAIGRWGIIAIDHSYWNGGAS